MVESVITPHSLCPYLTAKGAQAAIDFHVRALGATVDFRLIDPSDERIGHAKLLPDFGAVGPETLGGSPVKFHLNVADADAFVAHAVRHGATSLRAVKLEFYGDRTGLLADPFGLSWFIASKAEDVSAEEAQRRWDAMAGPALDSGSLS